MSYRLKLILTITLLIALSFGIGGTILITVSFNTALQGETKTALDHFEAIQSTLYIVNSVSNRQKPEQLQQILQQMAEQNMGSWYALTLTASQELVYGSNQQTLNRYDLPVPEEGQCSYRSISDSYGHGLIVRSTIPAGDSPLILTARFDLTGVYESRASQKRVYTVVYLIVVLVGALTAIVLSYALTGRLRRLAGAVRKISGGDLSVRSKLASQDEFGQLSRDFDAMADKLQQNISNLETDIQRQEGFMGAFAHELKTPMTSIIGFADLLRQGNLDENTRMMAAEYVYSESRRLERLSFKLLDLLLLKKDTVIFRRVWLSSFLSEVERVLSPALRTKGIRLVCKAETKRVALEPDLVKSLIYNLVDNAAKAMEGEGIIAVKATAIPGGCQFQVVDNGRGMEKAELSKITEAFYRVDKARSRSQGGAGLGLALCKQIVELHSGNIQFASEPGKGTRVTVTLYGKEASK